jgi:hypothetical protein
MRSGIQAGKKGFDTSGKSPADFHHRENFEVRSGETGRGFFHLSFPNRAAAAATILPRER